jgi:hypothetical protein
MRKGAELSRASREGQSKERIVFQQCNLEYIKITTSTIASVEVYGFYYFSYLGIDQFGILCGLVFVHHMLKALRKEMEKF